MPGKPADKIKIGIYQKILKAVDWTYWSTKIKTAIMVLSKKTLIHYKYINSLTARESDSYL